MTILGPRLNIATPKYIKHPPATAAQPLDNAYPLDAGSPMIIDNNWTHLDYVNLRELVHWHGHSNVSAASKTNNGWTGIGDLGWIPGDPSVDAEINQIPWGARDVSRRFGPFYIPVDKDSTAGGGRVSIRKITGKLGYYNNTNLTPSKLWVYITNSAATPRDGVLAGQVISDSTSGYREVTITLDATSNLEENSWIISRSTGERVAVLACYIWLGWALNDDLSDVTYFHAWEDR